MEIILPVEEELFTEFEGDVGDDGFIDSMDRLASELGRELELPADGDINEEDDEVVAEESFWVLGTGFDFFLGMDDDAEDVEEEGVENFMSRLSTFFSRFFCNRFSASAR